MKVCAFCKTPLPRKLSAFLVEVDGTFHAPTRCRDIALAQLADEKRKLAMAIEALQYAQERIRMQGWGSDADRIQQTLADLDADKPREKTA